jgi:hypothetical protein
MEIKRTRWTTRDIKVEGHDFVKSRLRHYCTPWLAQAPFHPKFHSAAALARERVAMVTLSTQ